MMRQAVKERKTLETAVSVSIGLMAAGKRISLQASVFLIIC